MDILKAAPDGRTLLNLGCGLRFHLDWTNVDLVSESSDVIAYNLLQGIPFADNSFDVVYSSHFFEHHRRDQAAFLTCESYRVLKQNGVFRIVVPDLEFSAQLYLRSLQAVQEHDNRESREHYEWSLLNLVDQMVRDKSGGEMVQFITRNDLADLDFVIANAGGTDLAESRRHLSTAPRSFLSKARTYLLNPQKIQNFVRWRFKFLITRLLAGREVEQRYRVWADGEIHKWMYDRVSIKWLLEAAGFRQIDFVQANTSRIRNWNTFELDMSAMGVIHKPRSLYVEALKE